MACTKFCTKSFICTLELAEILGISKTYVKNNGKVEIENMSSQLQASIKLLLENYENRVPDGYVVALVKKSDLVLKKD